MMSRSHEISAGFDGQPARQVARRIRWTLGFEVSSVIGLRVMKIAAGGPAATHSADVQGKIGAVIRAEADV
jgi:hypothetical protein